MLAPIVPFMPITLIELGRKLREEKPCPEPEEQQEEEPRGVRDGESPFA